MAGALASLFTFRHPVFFLSFILTIFLLFFILLASGVVGRSLRAAGRAIDAAAVQAGFGIVAVNVSGNVRTSLPEIMTALGTGKGQSVFAVDLFGARARLMTLPWIKTVSIRRQYPGTLDIAVTERQPYALWQRSDGDMPILIERSGERITNLGIEKFSYLPLVAGVGAAENASAFVEAVRRHRAVAANVKVYRYRSGRRWDLVLSNGMTVKLPEYGWKKQLDELERLILRHEALNYASGEIDLRSSTYFYFGQVPQTKTEEKKPEEGRAI